MWRRIKRWIQGLFERRKKETEEEVFLREWTQALTEQADVFNGLYAGLVRIRDKKTKKKARVMGEWWTRTRYRWEGQSLEKISRPCLEPLAKDGPDEAYEKWAGLLLQAAAAAGMVQDQPGEILLNESNTNAYVDWEGQELYLGDRVEIMTPAWYQNGRIIEQGHCRKTEESE